jgi:lipopolysaccharide/colanic/teichoic acid biosynthesis glycosyltransferase
MKTKRLIDIVVSGTALVFISPVLLLIALIIKLESKGPVLYGAYRAGKGYHRFKLLKFRTMYAGADQKLKNLAHLNLYGNQTTKTHSNTCEVCPPIGRTCVMMIDEKGNNICEYQLKEIKARPSAFFKIKDDPRITPVGKFLRNTSLDELPQLINVLRGDMSLVGNRPLPLYEAEQLTTDEAALRFLAPAGITGLWQVTKRGRKGEMSEEERIELDKAYARDHSLGHDIKLMLKTIPALLQKENV